MHSIFRWMNNLMRVLVLLAVTWLSMAPTIAARADGVRATDATVAVLAHGVDGGEQQPDAQQPKQTDEFVPVSQLPAQDQLPAAPLLVTAYAFVWVVLFAYVVSVGRRLTKVQHDVERLEADIAKRTRT